MPIKTDIKLNFSDRPLTIAVEKLSPNMLFALGLVGIVIVGANNFYKTYCTYHLSDTRPKISDFSKVS